MSPMNELCSPLDRNIIGDLGVDGMLAVLPKHARMSSELSVELTEGYTVRPEMGTSSIIVDRSVKLPFCQMRKDTPDIELTSSSNVDEQTLLMMKEAGLLLNISIARQLWCGDVQAREMAGVNAQIAGNVPRVRPDVNPTLTGVVVDFGEKDIHSTGAPSRLTGKPGEHDIVSALTFALRNLHYRANNAHLLPTEWTIAMRPELWWELAPIWAETCTFRPDVLRSDWPCPYCGEVHSFDLTACVGSCGGARDPAPGQYVCLYCGRVYHDDKAVCWDPDTGTGCGSIESTVLVKDVDGLHAVMNGDYRLMDWMMREGKLASDGYLYNVVVDHNIPQAGEHMRPWSNMYIIPMRVGGMHATRMEYVDYQAARQMAFPMNNMFWSDGGKFLWHVDQNRWDYRLSACTEQRIVCQTPHLMGCIKGISYTMPTP